MLYTFNLAPKIRTESISFLVLCAFLVGSWGNLHATGHDSILNQKITNYLTLVGTKSPDSILSKELFKIIDLTKVSDPITCELYLKKLEALHLANNNSKVLAEVYNLLGDNYNHRGLSYLALKNYFSCYSLHSKHLNQNAAAYSLCNMGNVYFAQNNFITARRMYNQAMLTFQQEGDVFGQSVILNNLGLINLSINQLDSALSNFSIAYTIRQKRNHAYEMAHSETYLGIVYTELKQFDVGLDYFTKAINHLAQVKAVTYTENLLLGKIYSSMADNYSAQKKFTQALNLLNKGMVVFGSVNDAFLLANTNLKIGKVLMLMGKLADAETELKKSLDYAYQSQSADRIKEVYGELVKLHVMNGMISEAFGYQKKYALIADSLLNSFNNNKFQEISLAVSSNEDLRQKAHLQQISTKNKQILGISVMAFVAILLFMIYMLRVNKKGQKRFKDLSNSTFEGIIIHSNGKIADLNERAALLFGKSVEELIGTDIFKYFDSEQVKKFQTVAFKTNFVDYTTNMVLEDGTIKQVEILSKPIKFRGRAMRVAAIRDITTISKTLEENKVLWTAITQTPSTILITNHLGRITYANPAFIKTTGYTLEEALGTSPGKLMHSGYHEPNFYQNFWETINKGNTWKGEFCNKKKDGSLFWENAIISPVVDSNGFITHYLAIKEDITLLKETEKTLNRQDMLYRSLARQLPSIGIVLFDKALNIVLADGPVIQQLKEHTPINEGKPAAGCISANLQSHLEEMMQKCFIGETFEFKTTVYNADYEIIIQPVKDEPKNVFLGMLVIRDITEELKKENILLANKQKLTELNDTKDKFFSIIAHDLRSPFNVILGFSDLLSSNFDELDDISKKSYIENIKEGAENTYKLLLNLLDWSRSQANSMEFMPENFNLYYTAEAATSMAKQQSLLKGITLTNTIPEETTAWADQNMIKTVIRNLVSNAIKYTSAGGSVTISATTDKAKQTVSVTVSDTGVGISHDVLPKLFKVGEKIKTNGTANETGTGLGLILCAEFIQKNHGTINVESTVGVGSQFIVTLPLVDVVY